MSTDFMFNCRAVDRSFIRITQPRGCRYEVKIVRVEEELRVVSYNLK